MLADASCASVDGKACVGQHVSEDVPSSVLDPRVLLQSLLEPFMDCGAHPGTSDIPGGCCPFVGYSLRQTLSWKNARKSPHCSRWLPLATQEHQGPTLDVELSR